MFSLFSSFDVFLNFFFWSSILFPLVFFSGYMSISKFKLFSSFIVKIVFTIFSTVSSLKVSKRFLGSLSVFFFCVFTLNYFSIFSYVFPLTRSVGFVQCLSLCFWFRVVFMGLLQNYKGFLSHLVPRGSPLGLVFFLVMIEVVRNIVRPITLIIRLVSNILAGHVLLILLYKLIRFLNFKMKGLYFVLLGVEMFVSVIQAYIFMVLVLIYYTEVV